MTSAFSNSRNNKGPSCGYAASCCRKPNCLRTAGFWRNRRSPCPSKFFHFDLKSFLQPRYVAAERAFAHERHPNKNRLFAERLLEDSGGNRRVDASRYPENRAGQTSRLHPLPDKSGDPIFGQYLGLGNPLIAAIISRNSATEAGTISFQGIAAAMDWRIWVAVNPWPYIGWPETAIPAFLAHAQTNRSA